MFSCYYTVKYKGSVIGKFCVYTTIGQQTGCCVVCTDALSYENNGPRQTGDIFYCITLGEQLMIFCTSLLPGWMILV